MSKHSSPVAPPSVPAAEIAPPATPAIAPPPNYPPGVAMVNAGDLSPYATKPVPLARDPKRPPPGFRGGYRTCGGCGDYLPGESHCPLCVPSAMPSNIHMSGPPKMVAK